MYAATLVVWHLQPQIQSREMQSNLMSAEVHGQQPLMLPRYCPAQVLLLCSSCLAGVPHTKNKQCMFYIHIVPDQFDTSQSQLHGISVSIYGDFEWRKAFQSVSWLDT